MIYKGGWYICTRGSGGEGVIFLAGTMVSKSIFETMSFCSDLSSFTSCNAKNYAATLISFILETTGEYLSFDNMIT